MSPLLSHADLLDPYWTPLQKCQFYWDFDGVVRLSKGHVRSYSRFRHHSATV
jgi:hypothetical protein